MGMPIVYGGERLPIKLWIPGDLGQTEYLPEGDQKVFQQFRNLANHPLAFKQICGMPDYHLGYGMPIGGVFATVGGVVPNAVGVDIGCGMIAMPTQWQAGDFDRDTLQALRLAIHRRVPVGNAHQTEGVPLPYEMLAGPQGVEPGHSYVVDAEIESGRVAHQLGTLGGGNHFIEIQREDTRWADENPRCMIADNPTHDRVWIMLHSGSRNVGYRVCQHYHKVALALMDKFHSSIPDRELAFLPEGTDEYRWYLAEMQWCLNFAEENRREMLRQVFDAFREVINDIPMCDDQNEVVDTHHNFVAQERHFGKDVWVHRKGAVKATGLVTIPGSMGTASYIGRGLEPRESFNTCSHGAGRVMGRRAAKAEITHEEAVAAMAHVVFGVREGEVDEMPRAYKDIDAVMAAQADLVEPVYRLLPLAVVKG